MNSSRLHLVLGVLLVWSGFSLAQAQQHPKGPEPVDPQTLRRLASLLGGESSLPNLDPKTLELLKEIGSKQKFSPAELESFTKWAKDHPDVIKQLPEHLKQPGQLPPEETQKLLEQFRQSKPMVTPQPGPNIPPVGGPQPGGPRANPPSPPPPFPPDQQPPPTMPPSPKMVGKRKDLIREKALQQLQDAQTNPTKSQIPPDVQKNQEFQATVKFWEQNVGPLNKTPEVQKALIDLFSKGGIDGASDGNSPFKDFLKDLDKDASGSNNSGFLKWLNNQTSGMNWKMPSWTNSSGGGGTSGWNTPSAPSISAPSFGGVSSFSIAGLGTVASIIVMVLVFLAVALVAYRVWPQIVGTSTPNPLPGLGPWPIDPRTIHDRPTLIIAFDYLSLLQCGLQARSWNHLTIASALHSVMTHSTEVIEPLAELYERARYSPDQEPLTDDQIAQARGYLCRLAGVSAT